ncbi:MAG: 2-oxoglutarate ferredoxin oxidoreductase subunit alpha [Deltaproteobacteria bacterium RIFCSPHIGHO2_12_FULL_43_9]|nr:MAG: 2-oxoglutarate ferredoxin oxidoreductase subunit alpha [Deltaproteobacteria bacterium RIFCSPHIGHO2_12_FULL_43_9]
MSQKKTALSQIQELDTVTIRFAGDSGDGMQLTGDQFARLSAILGENVITLADYPAEIRAPVGSLGGVSAFQLHLGSSDIYTSGDQVDVLVAMNPAALRTNLPLLREQGIIIANQDSFTEINLKKAGYGSNPLEGKELGKYRLFSVPISSLTKAALADLALGSKLADRSKNFFALGLTCWLFHHPIDSAEKWVKEKFKKNPEVVEANLKALQAGWSYGETAEVFTVSFVIKKPKKPKQPGTYRYVNGNSAFALGLITAATRAGVPLFLGSYPITPASDILHELSIHREFPLIVFQAEDEISAIGAAIGASYAGALAVTSTSGPGFSLKTEFLNLAVTAELPLIVINVQRVGPSTGLPTKTEQADLLQALWGRHGESPIVVLAARSSKDCFYIALEAAKIALKYTTPVIILSDGYLANGAETWRIPDESELPEIKPFWPPKGETFLPFKRDPETLARPWAIVGVQGQEHCLSGMEKEEETGKMAHDPLNHEKMVRIRAEKIKRVAKEISPLEVHGDAKGELLVIGWGSTYGAIMRAVENLNNEGLHVASTHLRYINPFPGDLGSLVKRFPKVLVVENNLGQLWIKLRAEFLVDAKRLNKIQGIPFRPSEIEESVRKFLGESK